MRRLIVISSVLVASAALLAMAGTAGASRVSRSAACPESIPCCEGSGPIQDPPHIIPCCGPPLACCGSTGCCPTTCCAPTPCASPGLTIASSPNPSTAGRKVVISGTLTANPTAGAEVVLWRERAGQSSFSQAATTSTNSSGAYAFTLKRVWMNQAWYVSSGSERSATIDQRVHALVGLIPSTRSIAAGQAIVLRGHVSPAHAGAVVLIEQRRGHTWHVMARPRLSNGSNYSLSRSFARAGSAELRALLQSDSRNVSSSSPVLTLSITS